jgi:hypothetical protein
MYFVILQMNDTRRDWTIGFDCNKVKEKNYNVLSLSGVFGFLTFIYYAAVRKHEKYKNKIRTRMYTFIIDEISKGRMQDEIAKAKKKYMGFRFPDPT